jgi:hypothetical protein
MYNSGNSSKNVTGSSVVDGTLENADFADNGLSGDKIDGGIISNFQSTGIDDNATSTAITIEATTGDVGIGTTNPNFSDFGSTTGGLHVKDAQYGAVKVEGDSTNGLFLISGGGKHWLYCKGATPLHMYTNSVNRLTLEAAGDVTVETGNLVIGTSGKGIDFSATSDGSGTMTSEVLDDYEEGTWEMNLVSTIGGTITISTTTSLGAYTKIGRVVHVGGSFNISAISTPTGDFVIEGLPFVFGDTAEQSEGFAGTVNVRNLATATTGYCGILKGSTASLYIRGGYGTTVHDTLVAGKVDTGTSVNFSATYIT